MNTQRNLLPWIVGGLCVAAVAVALAVTAVSPNGTAPLAPAPIRVAAAQPATAPPPAPTAAKAPIVAASPQAPPAASVEAPVTAGQIWQCTTNGVKTFSNNPCGEKSSLLEVGPINTMRPPPVTSYARGNVPQPHYVPANDGQSNEGGQDAYADDQGAGDGGSYYTVVQGVRILHRRRADHHVRPPPHHSSAPVLRKN